jgi:hypothetical protein
LRAVPPKRLGAEAFGAGEKSVGINRRFFVGAVEGLLADHVGHVLGDSADGLAQTQSSQDLQAAEGQVAGFGVYEDLSALFYQQRLNPVAGL